MSWCCGTATLSWFSCYPSECGSDGCCCNGVHCSEGCNTHTHCGQGACCTCDNKEWGFAYAGPGGEDCCGGSGNLGCVCSHSSVKCGQTLFISAGKERCKLYILAPEVDHGPACGLGRAADLTKSLFMSFAPLSEGLLKNSIVGTGNECC